MIIVAYMGGLGNQLFIYSMQTVLEILYPNQKVKADIHHYNLFNEHNGFELNEYFDIDFDFATKKESAHIFDGFVCPDWMSRVQIPRSIRWRIATTGQRFYIAVKRRLQRQNRTIRDLPNIGFNSKIFDLPDGDWFFWGLWQSVDYFEVYAKEIRNRLRFRLNIDSKDKKIIEKLTEGDLIAVHIRGGDFVNPMYQLCKKEYYEKASDRIERRSHIRKRYCVFTDDTDYAKTVLPQGMIEVIVSHPKDQSIIDMYMISCARYTILSNSTFAFWGAFLNKNDNADVVAPRYSYYKDGQYALFPRLKNWEIVDNNYSKEPI